MSDETGLESWFIHDKLILSLLPRADAEALAARMSAAASHPLARAMQADALERVVASYLEHEQVLSLDVALLRESLRQGQLVWLDQAIAFRGVSAALKRIQSDEPGRVTFTARLASAPTVRIRGDFNASRLTCSTAVGRLSGTRRQFMLAYVQEVSDEEIVARPLVIATRWMRPTPEIEKWYPVDPGYLWPAAVDQLKGVDWAARVVNSDLAALKAMPEVVVKNAFAEILAEPDVPKDWGGEQFDLWTTRLWVEGQPLRAAFLFKGPAEFRPMTIASLGKNGDQIDRLASSAADVLVVQHCHSITAPVVNMLRTYAADPRHPRRYMTIDGYDTVKILRHFGRLKR